jgi:hypothetical protein
MFKIEMKGLDSLDKAFKKAINDIDIEPTVDKTINKLKDATPIDTGEARESWHKVDRGDFFEIVNDAEHISQLNKGHSKQAPSRFIERTLLEDSNIKPVGVIVTTPR